MATELKEPKASFGWSVNNIPGVVSKLNKNKTASPPEPTKESPAPEPKPVVNEPVAKEPPKAVKPAVLVPDPLSLNIDETRTELRQCLIASYGTIERIDASYAAYTQLCNFLGAVDGNGDTTLAYLLQTLSQSNPEILKELTETEATKLTTLWDRLQCLADKGSRLTAYLSYRLKSDVVSQDIEQVMFELQEQPEIVG